MTEKEKTIYDLVRKHLTDDLIPKDYKDKIDSKYCGHCHHASLAMYHLLGGKDHGYKINSCVDELGIKHYWLLTGNNEIIDPTKEQYTDLNRKLPYENKKERSSYRMTNATKSIIEKVKSDLKNNT